MNRRVLLSTEGAACLGALDRYALVLASSCQAFITKSYELLLRSYPYYVLPHRQAAYARIKPFHGFSMF